MTRAAPRGAFARDLGGRRVSGIGNGVAVGAGPLVIALPGGSYGARYFDLPGHSFLARAGAAGLAAVALDRPGYGETEGFPPMEASVAANAARLTEIVTALREALGAQDVPVALVGHSIGGAVALTMGAAPAWPVFKIAVSGIGLVPKPPERAVGTPPPDAGPPPEMVELPFEAKTAGMFGPPGSYDTDAPRILALADAPMPMGEVLSITSDWPGDAARVLAAIQVPTHVPLHWRLPEGDPLWEADEPALAMMRAAAGPRADCALIPGTGHATDVHHAGAALHAEQITFLRGTG